MYKMYETKPKESRKSAFVLNFPTSKFKLIFPKHIYEYISYLKQRKIPCMDRLQNSLIIPESCYSLSDNCLIFHSFKSTSKLLLSLIGLELRLK